MSRRLIEQWLSDVSGVEGAHTVTVPAFEIDLTDAEEAELWAALDKFYTNGRKTDGRPVKPAVAVTAYTEKQERKAELAPMREWLLAHGYTLAPTGRIKAELQEAYHSKTPNPAAVRDHIRATVKAVKAAPAAVFAAPAPRAEPEAEQPVTPELPDGWEKQPKPKLVALATSLGVTTPGNAKVADLRAAIAKAHEDKTNATAINGMADRMAARATALRVVAPEKTNVVEMRQGKVTAAATKAAPARKTTTTKVASGR